MCGVGIQATLTVVKNYLRRSSSKDVGKSPWLASLTGTACSHRVGSVEVSNINYDLHETNAEPTLFPCIEWPTEHTLAWFRNLIVSNQAGPGHWTVSGEGESRQSWVSLHAHTLPVSLVLSLNKGWTARIFCCWWLFVSRSQWENHIW